VDSDGRIGFTTKVVSNVPVDDELGKGGELFGPLLLKRYLPEVFASALGKGERTLAGVLDAVGRLEDPDGLSDLLAGVFGFVEDRREALGALGVGLRERVNHH
jgi:hypothetical protein